MTDTVVSRSGQANLTGDELALFQRVLQQEILAKFKDKLVMSDNRMTMRSLSHGKSATFDVHGEATAYEHTPGQELDTQRIEHANFDITVDPLRVAPIFIAEIDEAMNHYDVRSAYVEEAAHALKLQYEQDAMRTMALAARSTSLLTTGHGGSSIYGVDLASDSSALVGAIWDGIVTLDDKLVSDDGRFALVKPGDYIRILRDSEVLNKELGNAAVYSEGGVLKIGNVEIIKATTIPRANDTANADINAKYRADFSETIMLMGTNKAVGGVRLIDLKTKLWEDNRRVGWGLNAMIAAGFGTFRPECAIEARAIAAP